MCICWCVTCIPLPYFMSKLVHLHNSASSCFCHIQIYMIYSLTQLSIKQLLLKDISHHIAQLHVSALFYGAILRKMAP